MKTRYYLLIALSLALGCKKEGTSQFVVQEDVPIFTVGFEDVSSKVGINGLGKSFWNEADSISVFTSTFNRKYVFAGHDGDTSGDFIPETVNGFVGANKLEPDAVYAVYPYQCVKNYDNSDYVVRAQENSILPDGTLYIDFPESQTYTVAGYDPKARKMVAVTSSRQDRYLFFKDICGCLVVRAKGVGEVKRLELRGNNGEILSGIGTVEASTSTSPTIKEFNEEPADHITLSCPVPIQLSEQTPTEFWFVVPPVTFEKGFSVYAYYSDEEIGYVSTSRPVTIQRGHVVPMSEITIPSSSFRDICIGTYQCTCNYGGTRFGQDVAGAVMQRLHDTNQYRIKNATGPGYHIIFNLVGDPQVDKNGDTYYNVSVAMNETGISFPYGAVWITDVASWQGDESYQSYNVFYPGDGSLDIWAAYSIGAGASTFQYAHDYFIPNETGE